MKKFLKINSYDSSAFTEDNVLNKTHWMVKILDRVMQLIDVGSYAITYVSATDILLSTVNHGNFTFKHPTLVNDFPFYAYVNSDDKELWMGSFTATSIADTAATATGDMGLLIGATRCSATSAQTFSAAGGIHRLKFDDLYIKGVSLSQVITGDKSSVVFSPFNWGNIGKIRKQSLQNPISGNVDLEYWNTAIIDKYIGPATTVVNLEEMFTREYFRSIFTSDKYYQGALASADGKLFALAGHVFAVDDASDIEDVI